MYKSRSTFDHPFWVVESRLILRQIRYTYRIIIIRWSCTLFSNSNCGTVSLSRNYSNNEYTCRIIIIRWSCTLFSNSNCGTVSLSRNYSNNEYTYRIIIISWSCTLFSNSNCGTVSLSRNYSNNESTEVQTLGVIRIQL